eukprot:1443470-Rhodomonas_salina.1
MGIGSSGSSSSISVPVSVLLGFGSSVVGSLLVSGSGFVSVWGMRCGRNWGWMGIFLFFVAS